MSDETELAIKVEADPTERLIVDRPWSKLSQLMQVDVSRAAAKAEPIILRDGMNVAEGFETVISACLRHFRLNVSVVVETRHVEGLHQARVAMRRLRSAFSLFRPVVADQEFKRIKDELSWFSAELGDARNLDIYLERDLSQDQRQFIEVRREKAYDNAIAAMDSARFRRLTLDLVGWAAAGSWRERSKAAKPLAPFVNRRIDRLWSKIRDSDAVADMGNERRHTLRIRMKKLRYALEFTEALHPRRQRRRKKFTKKVKNLQDYLGRLHDEVVAHALVTLNSWVMAPNLSAGAERRLVRDADRAVRRLRKIGRYWS